MWFPADGLDQWIRSTKGQSATTMFIAMAHVATVPMGPELL